ncbi:MAG: S8 family serine peptidase [Pseudonocardiales bacterium]
MSEATDAATTGRYLVLLEPDAAAVGARVMNQVAGLRIVTTADAATTDQFGQTNGLVLHELSVAVVTATAEQAAELRRAAAEPGPITIVEPEVVVWAVRPAIPVAEPTAAEETTLSWGLSVIGADLSRATGAGVRVAVLDTGLDLQHPDFVGRTVVSSSFIAGQEVHDGHGHGTHCIGTSCGPRFAGAVPGYGVAYESDIYAGKVLDNEGSGGDGAVLAGLAWAVANGCQVVSLSLGAPTQPGQPYSRVFEQVARRAMQRGALIIAAAGSESDRKRGHIASVGHPANCPSIMAIGAVDVQGRIANFSCGTMGAIGQIDLVAPGVDVHSSWPMPMRYSRTSGTSTAAPHVAGVAALIAGQHRQASPYELWVRLAQSAQRLNLPATDVGAGLVQIP